MRRLASKLSIFIFILGLVAAGASYFNGTPAHAYSNNDLIEDSVFDNTSTMTTTQIQGFLNNYPNSCIKSYQTPDITAANTYGGLVSTAQAVKDASTLWGINPQVILTTLQKEEQLVDGSQGCATWKYWSAMGEDCPGATLYSYSAADITSQQTYNGGVSADIANGASGTCVQNSWAVGLSAQISHGSWQLEFARQRSEGDGNFGWANDGSVTYYGYETAGTRARVQGGTVAPFDGLAYLSDGNTVTLANGATAALYTYTPYIQSFDTIFVNQFGFSMTNLAGSLDLVQQAPGSVRLAGWGLDTSTNITENINVYIDGGLAGVITANSSRPDVGAIYPAAGNNHGFDGTVPWAGGAGNHQVCAWIVTPDGQVNAGLGCRTVSINNDPTGSFDVGQQSPSAIRIAGWGFDRSLNGPAAIHVYIDGVWQTALSAGASRPDVGAAFGSLNIGSNHGFDGTVPWTASGSHQVCLWVVGDNLGAPNAGLGCKQFTY